MVQNQPLFYYKQCYPNKNKLYYPTLALDYKSTATYYWSLIAENGFVTDSVTGFVDNNDDKNNKVETSAGPFGFDEAILLGNEQVRRILV